MHKLMIWWMAALAAMALAAPQSTSARDIFVDNVGGDDRHQGESPAARSQGGGPCRTITKALRIARMGDRIVLANTGVPYRECVTLQAGRHSGTATRPFVLTGDGAILDGSRPVPLEHWEHHQDHVFRVRPHRVTHQQLFLEGVPLKRVPLEDALKLPDLEPLQWCLLDGYIYLRTEKDRLPQSYQLSYAGHTVGITLYEVRHVVIDNVIVQGFQLDGVNAHDSAFDVTLANVTARGNGRSGISVGGASQVTLAACLAGDNGAAQIRTEGYSHAHLQQTEVLANTAPAIVRDGGEVTIDGLTLEEDVLDQDIIVEVAPEEVTE